MRTGVRFCRNGHNVSYSIHVIYGSYRNLYKISAYCCEQNITERKADRAYVISMYVFNFIYLFDYSFILSYFCRKNSMKSYKQYLSMEKCFSIARGGGGGVLPL